MKHLYNTAGRLSFLWVTHLPEEPFTRRLFSSPVWKILDQIPGQKNVRRSEWNWTEGFLLRQRPLQEKVTKVDLDKNYYASHLS